MNQTSIVPTISKSKFTYPEKNPPLTKNFHFSHFSYSTLDLITCSPKILAKLTEIVGIV